MDGKIGVKLNDQFMGYFKKGQLLGQIFAGFICDLDKMSDDALRSLLEQAVEMLKEMGVANNQQRTLRVLDRYDRMVLERFIVNSVLASEGMGNLPNFGFAYSEKKEGGGYRIKGMILCNPEAVCIWDK